LIRVAPQSLRVPRDAGPRDERALDGVFVTPNMGVCRAVGGARDTRLRPFKAAFAAVGRMNRTLTAAAGAEELGMDGQAVVDVVAGLTIHDFDKSMRSEINPAIWQDVYKPIVDRQELYVKFTLDTRGELLLISFKENER
jgi:motility quorum-sensing regulator/GCU-specific mRNA interferase toxin